MDIECEDKKLHKDGIFDGLMGWREWFHYLCTFPVDGIPLTFMLGFVGSFPGWGTVGWISYNGKQYSLDGNTEDTDYNKFFEITTRAKVKPQDAGYRIDYPKKCKGSAENAYTGHVEGNFPDYSIEVKTPELDLSVTMEIKKPTASIYQRTLSPWISGGWFHSGDVAATLNGTIEGHTVESDSNKGWYERNWSKIPILLPAKWFWLVTHLDNGGILDLLIETFLGVRIRFLDECWLYRGETFHEFSDYRADFSEPLEKAIRRKDYSKIVGECFTCEGKNKGNSFEMTATITDFRQYEFRDYFAYIKWTNLLFETEGEARIEGKSLDLTGRGKAESAPIWYWWL